MAEDPNDFPFDIVFGENGDVCIALPVQDGVPDDERAVLKYDAQSLQANAEWVKLELLRSKDDIVSLMVDPATVKRLISRESGLNDILIAETDAEKMETRYLYTVPVAPMTLN